MFRLQDSLTLTGFASRRETARSHRAHLAVGAVAASAVALLAGAAPAEAKVPIVGEIPVVGKVVEGVGSVGEAVLNPAEAVLKGFVHLLQAIFGGFEAHLITEVIAGLLAIPNFNTGQIAGLEHTTTAIAAAMLGAVLTLSILRYYIAGLTNNASGGFEALQGLVRVVGAVGCILLWPGVFTELLQIPSAFNHALLGSTSVQHNVALLFDAALTLGSGAFALNVGLGLIFAILIGLISAVVFIALLWMKVLLSVMMMFLFVSMPLCIVLWPVPELSWLATSAMKALGVAVIVPSVWAILFSLSAAVNADVLTLAPSHSIIDTVIMRPLAGITLMLLCITIPRFLMRTALIGPHGQPGGWRVWRTVTFGMFAARTAAGGARSVAIAATEGHPAAARTIDALPSPVKPPTEPGAGSLAGRVVFGRSGYVKQDGEDAERVPAPNVSVPDRETGTAPAAASGAATVAGEAAGQAAGGASQATAAIAGQQAGVGRQRRREEADRAGAGMYRQAHSEHESSSVEDVRAAMARLPLQTQRRLAHIMDTNPDRLRDSIARALPERGWTAGEREALQTIGGARRKQAQDGMDVALAGLDHAPARAQAPTPASQPAPGAVSSDGWSHPSPASPSASQSSLSSMDASPPPSGTPSLGVPLREQPLTRRQQVSQPEADVSDMNPFRE